MRAGQRLSGAAQTRLYSRCRICRLSSRPFICTVNSLDTVNVVLTWTPPAASSRFNVCQKVHILAGVASGRQIWMSGDKNNRIFPLVYQAAERTS